MPEQMLLFVLVGALAQLVDGACGMAYGLIASSVLLGFGTAPATASASIHIAEVFTTAASGTAHWRVGNVDWRLAGRLAVPGVIGAVLGATLLANTEARAVRPFVSLYLLAMGGLILWRLIHRSKHRFRWSGPWLLPLGFAGGLLDTIGGGGWGSIVVATLLGRGEAPRTVIGSTNAAEFFVTLAASAAFLVGVGLSPWPVVVGLVIGGVAAAPFAALLARRLPVPVLLALVGLVVIGLALRNLWADLPGLLG